MRKSSLLVSCAAFALLLGGALMAAPSHATATPEGGGQTRIVGGTPARDGAYPWMARLISKKGATATQYCGASLISPDLVLTAWHCTNGADNFTVYYGNNTWRNGTTGNSNAFKAGGSMEADWAVLKLDRPATIKTFAPLPLAKNYDAMPNYTSIGWGLTSENGRDSAILLEVSMPRVENGKYDCTAGESELCTGDMEKGGRDTCQGDSGGPLMTTNTQGPVIVGIVSSGEGCARPKNPGHYARVSYFLPKIIDAAKQLGGTPGVLAP